MRNKKGKFNPVLPETNAIPSLRPTLQLLRKCNERKRNTEKKSDTNLCVLCVSDESVHFVNFSLFQRRGRTNSTLGQETNLSGKRRRKTSRWNV